MEILEPASSDLSLNTYRSLLGDQNACSGSDVSEVLHVMSISNCKTMICKPIKICYESRSCYSFTLLALYRIFYTFTILIMLHIPWTVFIYITQMYL